jgi:hypothetical protein
LQYRLSEGGMTKTERLVGMCAALLTLGIARESASQALLTEPRVLAQAVEAVATNASVSSEGFYPELGSMITGSGWISGGPGYRRHFLNDRGLFDASAAVSWRAYKVAQARFELNELAHGRLSVGAQALWQDLTQVDYFGLGHASQQANRTEYRLRTTDVVAYGSYSAARWLAIQGSFGWLGRPTISRAVGPFNGGFPDTRATFGVQGAPGINDAAALLHSEISASVDTRPHAGYSRHGGVVRVSWSMYADRDTGKSSFRRYEAEGARYVPVIEDRWTLAFHGWLVVSETTSDHLVPFFVLPSLGGQDTLRGYLDYRFHDRDMAVVNVESRWALLRHLDVAVFGDAGNVADRIGDLNLEKASVGIGIRAHSRTSTVGRLDLAHGVEGWRVVFRTGDALALSRLSRHTLLAPFVP